MTRDTTMDSSIPAARGLLFAVAVCAYVHAPFASSQDNNRPTLEPPIECEIGVDCYVQNYVDTAPGKEFRDHTCGHLSYDGHDGTDIRLPNLVAMQRGVKVKTAAPGVVRATRDNMDDVSVREIGREAVKGREAGNAVAIRHGEGWETQYSHLRRGSVRVQPGQRVKAGDEIGLVGLSGNTEFPHVHFEVRHNGKPVDPFTGLGVEQGCGKHAGALWSERASREFAYVPTAVLSAGFTDVVPEAEQARAGQHDRPGLPTDAKAIIFWVDAFGVQKGDTQVLKLTGPDEQTLAESTHTFDRPKAQRFSYVGKRLRGIAWRPGIYRGEHAIMRGEQDAVTEVARIVRTLEVKGP